MEVKKNFIYENDSNGIKASIDGDNNEITINNPRSFSHIQNSYYFDANAEYHDANISHDGNTECNNSRLLESRFQGKENHRPITAHIDKFLQKK